MPSNVLNVLYALSQPTEVVELELDSLFLLLFSCLKVVRD